QSTAVTAEDGSYQLTVLRSRVFWSIGVMEQPGFLPKTGTSVELCEKRDMLVAPISALRTIAGLSLQRGATVTAGLQSLTWQPLAGAEEYCVVITTPGDPSTFKRWTPDECSDVPPYPRGARVTDARYVSPALPAGGVYELGIYARAKGEIIGEQQTACEPATCVEFGRVLFRAPSRRGEGRRTWKAGSWLGKSFDTFA